MTFGGGIGLALALLALLTGLAAAATFIALGAQRGRVERLEKRNGDLEKEIEDEKRRHTTTRSDLQDVTDRGTRQQSLIDHLKGEVETLSSIPLAAMAAALESHRELLAAHHKEAMLGQEMQYALMLDVAHMLGDGRSRKTIGQAMDERAERDA